MQDNKERNIFYITHSGELLIWLIIVLIIVMIYFFSNNFGAKALNEYNIFMPDVDGLIVGSPVRTMGIQVGHVVKIKPMKDEVFVKFIITDKNIDIPQGTVATVEFSGLAGSKSLELYLPNEQTYIDSSVPLLSAAPTKRLHDAAKLLNEMFKKIGNIIIISSRFSKELREIDFPEKHEKVDNQKEFLQFANEMIDNAQERVDNLGRKLNNERNKR